MGRTHVWVKNNIFAIVRARQQSSWRRNTRGLVQGFAHQPDAVIEGHRSFLQTAVRGTVRWIGVWLDGKVDWGELADLLRDAYR